MTRPRVPPAESVSAALWSCCNTYRWPMKNGGKIDNINKTRCTFKRISYTVFDKGDVEHSEPSAILENLWATCASFCSIRHSDSSSVGHHRLGTGRKRPVDIKAGILHLHLIFNLCSYSASTGCCHGAITVLPPQQTLCALCRLLSQAKSL